MGPSWAQMGGPNPGPRGWAHTGPKWVGPELFGKWVSIEKLAKSETLSTARVSLQKYFIPGCVGRGLDLDLRIRPAAAPAPAAASGNPGFGPLGI